MMKRYIALLGHLTQLETVNLDKIFLSVFFYKLNDVLAKRLEHLNDVPLQYQQQACTMRQARVYLVSVPYVYPIFEARLMQYALIVHSLFLS